MRISVLIFFLLLDSFSLFGQVNEVEAKASYMLAEENYGKANYPVALQFLKNARLKLGGNNCKILYLQIQIESEVAKTQKNYRDSLLKTIDSFQASPDIKEFNEEKVLEVVKMKLELEQRVAEEKIQEEKKAKETVEREKSFKATIIGAGWEFGQTLEEAEKKHADFFRKTQSEKSIRYPGLKLISSKDVAYLSVYINKNKKIVGFRTNVMYAKLISKYQNYVERKDQLLKQVDLYTQIFGFSPVSGFASKDGLSFIWKKEQKSLELSWAVFKNGSGFYGVEYWYEIDESIQ